MEGLFIPTLVLLTSIGAYVIIGTRGFGLLRSWLLPAFGRMLECIGVMVGFFVVNLTVGTIIIFGLRYFTQEFVPLYSASDDQGRTV